MPAGRMALQEYVHPSSRRHPYAALEVARAHSPFRTDEGLVVVGRYGTCADLLRDPRMSSDRDRGERRTVPRSRNFLHLDPPDHTRTRRLVSKAFTPRMVAGLEPRIRQITEDILAEAGRTGGLEVVADLAYPLPLRVMCDLLGVPFSDQELILHWSARLAGALEPPLPGLSLDRRAGAEAARARADFVTYFRDLIDERRRSPRPDLISHLVQVSEDADQLSQSELLATCVLLINAGHETTVNLITNGILALLDHPEQARLLGEPTAAAGAVEEILRYDAPVQLTTRVAAEDLLVEGMPVRAGEMILLLLAAANRDPEQFDQPDLFDIGRPNAASHLSFAAGAHFCLGAGLARLEGRVVFEAFSRLANPRLTGLEIAYKPHLSLRGPARLPLHVDAPVRPAVVDG